MPRNQLPPQIRKLQLPTKTGRDGVRYEVRADTGYRNGKRTQYRRRFRTEREARDALAAVRGDTHHGTYVHPNTLTVQAVVDGWLASKHRIKPSTRSGYETTLAPVVETYGTLPVQQLTRRHVDELVGLLRAGGTTTARGTTRGKWPPRTVNYMLTILTAALDQPVRDGLLVRNPAKHVDRIPAEPRETTTWTQDQAATFLGRDHGRYRVAWMLALYGLRRGEICGLRWVDINLQDRMITIANTRVVAGKQVHEGTPKSARSRRHLPLSDDLRDAIKAERKRQAADRLAMGGAWVESGYVVVQADGSPVSPGALSSRWVHAVQKAGVPVIRLHDARHTCATVMHLQGVPIAVVAQWLGHASAAFTMATYAHSQDPALKVAASSVPVVANRGNNDAHKSTGTTDM
ncbi:site-specific integrase [Tomitella gaofuii]|uniref:site-specific integrase n=1 Tax=Tomitella gaofuii TaxID=2760083 RepID=UPI0015FA0D36|nr:site-specific integrase [Tomitella gaofuii]